MQQGAVIFRNERQPGNMDYELIFIYCKRLTFDALRPAREINFIARIRIR